MFKFHLFLYTFTILGIVSSILISVALESNQSYQLKDSSFKVIDLRDIQHSNNELNSNNEADILVLEADSSEISQLSTNSHKVIATGWPTTSPMWPSIDTSSKPKTGSNQELVIEPFIYADKPRSVDYSLLPTINETIVNILKNHLKPMSISLSFQYYFNYDQKLTALPAIKIELDRKQLKHLEPSGTQQIKAKMWIDYNEVISVNEPEQFTNHDWLKLSLVVRQAPSLVAIRHLKVVFLMNQATEKEQTSNQLATNSPPIPPQTPPVNPTQSGGYKQVPKIDPRLQQPQNIATLPNQVQFQNPPQQAQQSQYTQLPGVQYTSNQQLNNNIGLQAGPLEEQSAASNIIETTIKPVAPKRSGWGIWGRRRKREASDDKNTTQTPTTTTTTATNIELSCFRSDACQWQADGIGEQIQWSLARMPPSTSNVQNGYYYVSNRDNYGDASKLLRLSLNQTDSATIADQNAQHCLELALYVTEKTYLKLYRLDKGFDENLQPVFTKRNLLLTWAPTMISEFLNINLSQWRQRNSLPNSRLIASDNNQNGWTLETICFDDFFGNSKDCGAGNCYIGFEMETEPQKLKNSAFLNHKSTSSSFSDTTSDTEHDKISNSIPPTETPRLALSILEDKTIPEQVVGVALLKEYSVNIPIKSKSKWLETWQRDEVKPGDNWKFYPKLDIDISTNNISLMNLFDDSHYFVESEWLNVDYQLDLNGVLLVEVANYNESVFNSTSYTTLLESLQSQSHLLYQQQQQQQQPVPVNLEEINLFQLKVNIKLVDANFDTIYLNNSTLDWQLKNNETFQYNLGLSITDKILSARNNQLKKPSSSGNDEQDSLFKVVIEFILSLNSWLFENNPPLKSTLEQFLTNNTINYKLSLVNVSISDRCFPNPCQFGSCQQNGTNYEDWNCLCDDKHRGRRCEFGKWCNLAHVTPWQPTSLIKDSQSSSKSLSVNLKSVQQQQQQQSRQAKVISESITRISGRDYCQRKLGNGFKCTDIDLPLNENLYTEEEKTFICSCQDDYYLSDDAKCKQAHLCNSVVCPSIGMICDESKPFNRSQPCQCNEKQDWHPNPAFSSTQLTSSGESTTTTTVERCIRHQCKDIKKDCGFEAHICLPTLPGEKPICKCGPKFTLKTNDKNQKYCESTACVLPTLNDCEQICQMDNSNQEKPYTCACHPGYELKSDKRGCIPIVMNGKSQKIVCKPGCNNENQICTEAGCKCKQGYIGESEVIVQRNPLPGKANSTTTIDYVQSVKCLNVCSLTYAENKQEFEMVESVCPLGLCNPNNFHCRCSDPSSSALINTKYEPIYEIITNNTTHEQYNEIERKRASPLCHLRRVCEPESSSWKICKSQGAICIPDYTKAAMFDCICPPSTEKKFYGQASSSEFTCEPKCSAKKYDCLRKQAVCKLVDKDQVRCDCLPGLMFDNQEQKCYLAKYSYSFNLIIVNRYYEPESRFHKIFHNNSVVTNLEDLQNDNFNKIKLYELSSSNEDNDKKQQQQQQQDYDAKPISELVPQFQKAPPLMAFKSSIFIKEFNQCNITQVIPKTVIEDPYEHDIESYLSYIDQCNEKIHQNVRTYHLNSKLSEDLRQSLRQHLRDFTVTTNNSSCVETNTSGMYLNCTIYLQSNEMIHKTTVESVFNDCDKNGYQSDKYCWIKPRLLLKKSAITNAMDNANNQQSVINFNQVVPCEIDNFCGLDAISTRLDNTTSLCSCKCPTDIEVIDVKELEPGSKQHSAIALNEEDPSRFAIKEICAPRNHCGANSTFCFAKIGSVCQYDIRLGSKCTCVYPSYEDSFGKCVEVTFSQLDNTLIIIIILLITSLAVSLTINFTALFRSKSLFGRSKQYPLNEYPSSTNRTTRHPNNRSTGVPNPVFTND